MVVRTPQAGVPRGLGHPHLSRQALTLASLSDDQALLQMHTWSMEKKMSFSMTENNDNYFIFKTICWHLTTLPWCSSNTYQKIQINTIVIVLTTGLGLQWLFLPICPNTQNIQGMHQTMFTTTINKPKNMSKLLRCLHICPNYSMPPRNTLSQNNSIMPNIIINYLLP